MKTQKNTTVVIRIDSVNSRETTLVVDNQQEKRLLRVPANKIPCGEIARGAVLNVEREVLTDRIVSVEILGYCAGPNSSSDVRNKYGYVFDLEIE